MNQQVMTLEEFKNCLDTFGADFGRWPESDRVLALNFIDHSDAAKKLLVDMNAFEQFLTAYKNSEPPKDLLQKIIQKAHSD